MSEYRLIPLTGKHGEGKFAMVDPEDHEIMGVYRWHVIKALNGSFYPVRSHRANGKKTARYLHKEILKVKGFVDHENGDTLDARRQNLRP